MPARDRARLGYAVALLFDCADLPRQVAVARGLALLRPLRMSVFSLCRERSCAPPSSCPTDKAKSRYTSSLSLTYFSLVGRGLAPLLSEAPARFFQCNPDISSRAVLLWYEGS